MEINILPGRYVLAVSGGVDSMALLHALKDVAGVELIVAHFDHGIRTDSGVDRQLVQDEAERRDLKFELKEGHLDSDSSEAVARKARYDFLELVRLKYEASAIITAHHQDDVLETAVLNLSRGTGWRGLISLSDNEHFKRPLLDTSKAVILEYAYKNNLVWREDSTNTNEQYLRNYIRHTIMPQFGGPDRNNLVKILNGLRVTGSELNNLLSRTLKDISHDNELNRSALSGLPIEIIQEILIAWWRQNGFYGYESKTLKRAIKNIQINKSGLIVPLKGSLEMLVGRTKLALIQRER